MNKGAFQTHVAEALGRSGPDGARRCWTGSGRRRGRGGGAVTALGDVIEVLRRGQVPSWCCTFDALTGGLAERTLWVGPEPLQLATSASDLASIA